MLTIGSRRARVLTSDPHLPSVGLAELFDFASGLSKPASEFGFGAPFLSFKEVFGNFFLERDLEQLVNSDAVERQKHSVKTGDVFLTRTSETQDELGMSAVALRDYPEATFNGFTKRLRPKPGVMLYPRYLAYAFRSPQFRTAVTSLSSLATRASLNNEMLSRLSIPCPDWETQRRIGDVLYALDAKVALNRRLNETLEAMARALFRSWFVDFDPVRAKSEGRPTGLPADLDILFPSEFEGSPLGEIPKGWRAGTVEEVADCRRRSASTSSIAHDEPYVGLEHIDKKSLALSSWGTGADVASQKSRFQAGEVLFGKLRPYFHKVCIAAVAGICSTDILVVDSREPGLRGFVILALSEESTIDFVTASSGGTRMPRTSWSDLARVPLVVPPLEVAAALNELVAESLEHIQNSAFENQSLAAQRDFLLPKLLSGEIEVAEAEAAAP